MAANRDARGTMAPGLEAPGFGPSGHWAAGYGSPGHGTPERGTARLAGTGLRGRVVVSGTVPVQGEPVPAYGEMLPAAPGIWRVVAPNPGPMTLHGTNTYLVDVPGGLVVVDPGPDDAGHVAAVLRAAALRPAGRVTRIVLTHGHADHLGALPALRDATGAPTAGFHVPQDASFRPDLALRDGEAVDGLVAVHTPGHASDHLCLARDGVLLSGDHVMAWSTTVVSPPAPGQRGGNMGDYLRSLRRLLERPEAPYLPGHGPALARPLPYVRALLTHRLMREAAIAARLAVEPVDVAGLVAALYPGLQARLVPAAGRSVLAHLAKLREDGRAREQDGGWVAVG